MKLKKLLQVAAAEADDREFVYIEIGEPRPPFPQKTTIPPIPTIQPATHPTHPSQKDDTHKSRSVSHFFGNAIFASAAVSPCEHWHSPCVPRSAKMHESTSVGKKRLLRGAGASTSVESSCSESHKKFWKKSTDLSTCDHVVSPDVSELSDTAVYLISE